MRGARCDWTRQRKASYSSLQFSGQGSPPSHRASYRCQAGCKNNFQVGYWAATAFLHGRTFCFHAMFRQPWQRCDLFFRYVCSPWWPPPPPAPAQPLVGLGFWPGHPRNCRHFWNWKKTRGPKSDESYEDGEPGGWEREIAKMHHAGVYEPDICVHVCIYIYISIYRCQVGDIHICICRYQVGVLAQSRLPRTKTIPGF